MSKSTPLEQKSQCEPGPNGLICGSTSFSTYSTGASPNDALLTVFQAEPLAYVDATGSHPVPFLDFEHERDLLEESLKDGSIEIDLKFDVATTERLGRFLAKAQGRVLHFSCHGHPDYLAIENGWGAMHMLPVPQLRDWIQAGGESLKFVFVSACHSRSAGDAFLKAGVRHVVCCQRDDQPILNASSVIFARAFYQALANGRFLSQAFSLARQQVVNSPDLPRGQGMEEANKFALLPEQHVDHNVAIFLPATDAPLLPKSSSSLSINPTARVLPLPPQIFVGRQVDTWKILDALKSARVVRVTGAFGVGKGSAVQKVCQYIQGRQESCMQEIGEILWLPNLIDDQEDDLSGFSQIFDSDVYRCPRHLLTRLFDNKALLVIDARKAQSPQSFINIASFIHDIIHHTRDTRVIVIHHLDTNRNNVQNLPCKERDVFLDPLDFVTSAYLFGKLCQHVTDRRCKEVSNSTELAALVVPKDSPSDKPQTRRRLEIFKMIGEGIPAQIHHAAKHMTGVEYDRMIALGKRKDQILDFTSRAALEKEFSEQVLKLECARKEKRWEDATVCHDVLQEMELLREKLHNLPKLRSLAKAPHADLVDASNTRDFLTCVKLQGEVNVIEERIKIEKLALAELGEQVEDELEQQEGNLLSYSVNPKRHETRVELDMQIRNLDRELEMALEDNHFGQARKIYAQMKLLQERCSNLPTRNDLMLRIATLQGAMKQAKAARSIDLAESLYMELNETKASLAAENEACALLLGEEDLGMSRHELNGEKFEMGEIATLPSSDNDAHHPDTTVLALGPSSVTEGQAGSKSRLNGQHSTSSHHGDLVWRPEVPNSASSRLWTGEVFARQLSASSLAQGVRPPPSQPPVAVPSVASLPRRANDFDAVPWEHPSQAPLRPSFSARRSAHQNNVTGVCNEATSEASYETEYQHAPTSQVLEARLVDADNYQDQTVNHEQLLLERMSHESISNMPVAAAVEVVIDDERKGRRGKNVGQPLRNLFGMRKQKSKFESR